MKEFNLRELTKRGCTRREEKDFRDDGTKFKVLEYKGIEISYTKSEGEYFLSIRLDYYSRGLEYRDIPTELFKLADEYNGCYEIDPDKVIENLEIINKGLEEVENKINKELETKLDTTPLKERSEKEIELGKKAISDFKSSEVIYNITSEWDLKNSIRHLRSIEEDIKKLEETNWDELENKEIRHRLISLEEYGSIKLKETSYSIESLYEYIEKYSK